MIWIEAFVVVKVFDYMNQSLQNEKAHRWGIVYDEAASLKYGELFEETFDQKEKGEDGKEEEDILLAQDVELW